MKMEDQQVNHACSILKGIGRLSDPRHREKRHKLRINGHGQFNDRQSLEYLVEFLNGNDDSPSHEVTHLKLKNFRLCNPFDDVFQVLREVFARNDHHTNMTLTEVTLSKCDCGTQQQASSQILAAFQTNRTVKALTIEKVRNLQGAALGTCLSSLLQSMPQLQRLDCSHSIVEEDGIRALQPSLRAKNNNLKALIMYACQLGNEGIRLLVDALIGNTTLEILDIRDNDITSDGGLDDITRLIADLTSRLKKIDFGKNKNVFDNKNATRKYVTTLDRNTTVEELQVFRPVLLQKHHRGLNATTRMVCDRNRSVNQVDSLLLAPTRSPAAADDDDDDDDDNGSGNDAMLVKIYHKAITKFAHIPNKAGASAIFKLLVLRAHPELQHQSSAFNST